MNLDQGGEVVPSLIQTNNVMLHEQLIPCCVCNSEESITLFNRGRFAAKFNTVICKHCGFTFISPREVKDMSQYYQEGGYRRKESSDIKISQSEIETKMSRAVISKGRALKRYQLIRQSCEEPMKNLGKLLDIGTNLGHFLNFAKADGFDVYGIEPDTFHAKIGSDYFKIPIMPTLYEMHDYGEKFFDFITCAHVLEHCDQPREVLKKTFKELKDEGYLYIEVPCIEKPYGGNLEHFFWREHINYFSKETLSCLLMQEKFNPIRTGYNGHFLWILAKKNPELIYHPHYPCNSFEEILMKTYQRYAGFLVKKEKEIKFLSIWKNKLKKYKLDKLDKLYRKFKSLFN